MTDALGYRAKFGVLGPSTNTIVQPDFDDMRVPGVTNHYSRIIIQNANAISNESFMAGTLEISENVIDAVNGVLTCAPDYLVMGMSAVTFYGGAEGGAKWKARVEDASGLRLSVGSEAVVAAMQVIGGIKNIAFMSPYYPVANDEVRNYLSDHGFNTVRDACLQCPSWTAIAEVQVDEVRASIQALDSDEVDAIVQVGTNLSAIRLCAELELELGKPVIAINTATYWHALRANKLNDQLSGFGQLLENH